MNELLDGERETEDENTMVQQLSGSDEIRTRERFGAEAGKAPGMGRLRMEGGMVTASSGGMAAKVVKQNRRKYSEKLREADGWLEAARRDAKQGDYKQSYQMVLCACAALDLACQYETRAQP